VLASSVLKQKTIKALRRVGYQQKKVEAPSTQKTAGAHDKEGLGGGGGQRKGVNFSRLSQQGKKKSFPDCKTGAEENNFSR